MLTSIAAKILRLLPNKAVLQPMVDHKEVEEVRDILIETSVKDTYITCYYPFNASNDKLPVYINFHGGAFIMHNKNMDDPYCRYIANQTGCAVINIDYAKAPEYPFPKPIKQSYEIYQWILNQADKLKIDPHKIIVGGHSSGASIANALTLTLKKHKKPLPLLQILTCPMLDFVTPHAEKPEDDPLRKKFPQAAHFINRCYIPEAGQAKNLLVSPVFTGNVEGLPRTVILYANCDAFSAEAEKYIEKLKQAQVDVHGVNFRKCTHAFTHLGPKEQAGIAWGIIIKEIQEIYHN
ncbi:alpha/beta hydrolase [Halobacillus massiliensis]|uniref:alpha/beta hydrolase n=1 Tax=Halobacillus massiliensis TaxID=1926286 RepID=UPI0009E422A0|nr:alpha/beta hydrolase [Halobacillus massiliensis]